MSETAFGFFDGTNPDRFRLKEKIHPLEFGMGTGRREGYVEKTVALWNFMPALLERMWKTGAVAGKIGWIEN